MNPAEVGSSVAELDVALSERDQAALDSFNQMFGNQKDRMRITDDLVARDPELWDCERD